MQKIFLVANTDWYLYNFRLSLARQLRAAGFAVTLVSPGGPFAAGIQEEGFRWVEWSVGRQSMEPGGELAALVRLALFYRRERPDLVHHFTVKPVLYGTLAAELVGVPAVADSITGLGYLFVQHGVWVGLLRGMVLLLYRLAFRNPHLSVIFENGSDRDFFLQRRLVHPLQTTIIPGVGVDLEKYYPAPAPGGVPLVVLPARMLWDKGVGLLVEAARLLKDGGVDVRVALVGATDPGNPSNIPEDTLHQWVEQGLVEWWGFRRDMLEVYRQASVVALPSAGEGLPTVLLEAAACGRAIIASDVPGCREVVVPGETGLLVERTPSALAKGLRTLLSDPALRQRLADAGRRRVEEIYSDTLINQETLRVYRTLLNQ